MRIGLLAYLLSSGRDYRAAGVSVYTRKLLEQLPQVRPENEYLVFHGKQVETPAGLHSISAPIATSSAPVRIAWEEIGFPLQAARKRLNLVHSTVNVLPELTRGPSVVTVHDLSFFHYPDRLSRSRRLYLEAMVARSARRATRVIAVSGSTRDDLVELLRVPEKHIDVIHLGVDASFHPQSGSPPPQQMAGRPYILHVGTLEPRKNIDVLIRGFALLRDRLGIPHQLALVGSRGWMYDSLFALVSELGLKGDVQFVDYVAQADLSLWYTHADLFAYPSAYEGFGLPVLEAMACGLPVTTSDSSSLREVAADAAILVEPGSPEALEEAMGRILTDTELRRSLSERGLARASQFSWAQTALKTVATYEAACAA